MAALVFPRTFLLRTKLIPSPISRFRSTAHASSTRRLPSVKTRAISGGSEDSDELSAVEITFDSALKLFQVDESASFDEILSAKKRIIAAHAGDQEKLIQVEAAYDVLLMQSLSKRRAGKVSDNSVKYADVVSPQVQVAKLANSIISTLPVQVSNPGSTQVLQQTAVFAGLAAWTLIGAVGAPPPDLYGASQGSDVPGLQLAAGFGASIYFLRKQNVGLGKAALLAVGGLATGVLVGSLLEAWLRVDIFPVLGVSSPAVVLSEAVFVFLWLVSTYVR